MEFEVGLFAIGRDGAVSLIGRTQDPELVRSVREELAAAHRRELGRLEGPVRLVPMGEGADRG